MGELRSAVQRSARKTSPSFVAVYPTAITPAALYATAFAAATQVPATAPPGSAVVWADGEHELLIQPGQVRVLLRDGFVLVGITVFTEQTGTVEITVPFAVGTAAEPAGLMIATEPVPRGPALVVERWGDQLIAALRSRLLPRRAGTG